MPSIVHRDEVVRLRDQGGAQLLEVLPTHEYDDEHIAGAINLPLKELSATTAKQLDPARPIITYCHDYL
jgi:rhodanese-related sulfurtransferase